MGKIIKGLSSRGSLATCLGIGVLCLVAVPIIGLVRDCVKNINFEEDRRDPADFWDPMF